MEIRQLDAFVAVADELHFGRAAERLHVGQPTLSDLIRRLEREVGAALFTRTTRRVALTEAGVELLGRARMILAEVAAATEAVGRVARGDGGVVRVGVTPPVAPVLAPHLRSTFAADRGGVELLMTRMWLPDMARSLSKGVIDVGITCGLVPDLDGLIGEVFCAEPLLVGLRTTHRCAGRGAVRLAELTHDVLGVPDDALFPAWRLAQRQALLSAGVAPEQVELDSSDLAAQSWTKQLGVDWVLTTASVFVPSDDVVTLPVAPPQVVPYTLQWNPERARSGAVSRFVHLALAAPVPAGWATGPGHLHHAH